MSAMTAPGWDLPCEHNPVRRTCPHRGNGCNPPAEPVAPKNGDPCRVCRRAGGNYGSIGCKPEHLEQALAKYKLDSASWHRTWDDPKSASPSAGVEDFAPELPTPVATDAHTSVPMGVAIDRILADYKHETEKRETDPAYKAQREAEESASQAERVEILGERVHPSEAANKFAAKLQRLKEANYKDRESAFTNAVAFTHEVFNRGWLLDGETDLRQQLLAAHGQQGKRKAEKILAERWPVAVAAPDDEATVIATSAASHEAPKAADTDRLCDDPSSPEAVAKHWAETARLIEESRNHPERGLTAEEKASLDEQMGTPAERVAILRALPTAEQVPPFLSVLPRWVCWRKVQDENNPQKFRKPPFSPLTGKAIGAVEKYAAEFTDFATARAAAVRFKMSGVGFVFRQGDELVGIDIDNAIGADGALSPEVQTWLRWFSHTWAEYSPSGRGIHIVGHAAIAKALTGTALSETCAATFEAYATDRFFSVTGKLLEGAPLEVQDIQASVTKLLSALHAGEPSDAEPNDSQRPMSRASALRVHARNLESLRKAKMGEGNGLLNATAFFTGRAFAAGVFEETEGQLKQQMLHIVTVEWKYPHPTDGAVQTIASGWQAGLGKPLTIASLGRTDAANAERFVAQHADKARYCGTDKTWYVWDGRRWAPSLRGEHVRLALETVRSIYIEVSKITDEDERNDLIAWAKKSEMAPQVLNMLKLAASFKEMAIISTDLDANPWLLTVENGTIELESGTLREHRREDLISKMVHVEFKPQASCPVWQEHLELVLPQGDTRTFFQRAAGYSLTGLDVEEVFFFLQGGGQNGKSKTLEILAALLGDYAWTSTFGAFMRSHNGVPLNVIADMMGRRFVVVDEGEENQSFNESLLKNMTGGGTVSGRQLYSRAINYRPTFKLWFGSNYKPNIQGMDLAIWRRVRLIPFNVTIPEERRDKFFSEKLKAELPGILNWALAGLAEWQKSGLGVSGEVRSATRAYRTEMDTVKEFVDECCERREKEAVKLTILYGCFHEWSKRNGNEWPLKKRPFMDRIRKLGFVIPEGGTHARIVRGIGLVSAF